MWMSGICLIPPAGLANNHETNWIMHIVNADFSAELCIFDIFCQFLCFSEVLRWFSTILHVWCMSVGKRHILPTNLTKTAISSNMLLFPFEQQFYIDGCCNSTCQLKSLKKFDSECLILPHKTNDLFRIVRNSSIRFKRIHSINTHLICWCTVVSLDCYLWITVTMENIKSLVRIKADFSVGIRWNDSQETATNTKRIRCLQDSHSKCSFTLKLNH